MRVLFPTRRRQMVYQQPCALITGLLPFKGGKSSRIGCQAFILFVFSSNGSTSNSTVSISPKFFKSLAADTFNRTIRAWSILVHFEITQNRGEDLIDSCKLNHFRFHFPFWKCMITLCNEKRQREKFLNRHYA